MIKRTCLPMVAIGLCLVLAACNNLTQSQLAPSVYSQVPQSLSVRSVFRERAYTWHARTVSLGPGKGRYLTYRCSSKNAVALSGGFQTHKVGRDIVIEESFPSNGYTHWTFEVHNSSPVRTEWVRLYTLCAS